MRKPGRYYNQFKRRVKKHTFTWNKRIELQMNAKLAFPQRKEKVKETLWKRQSLPIGYLQLTKRSKIAQYNEQG